MEPLPRQLRRSRRAGITLVESLVAIAIIAVLAGLTLTFFGIAQRAEDNFGGMVARVSPAHARKHPPVRHPAKSGPIPNQYLVTFKPTVANPQAEAARLGQTIPAQVLNVYTTALRGCSVRIQPGDVALLQADPAVADVEQDQYYSVATAVFPTGVSRIQYQHAPRTPLFQLRLPTLSAPVNTGGGPRNLPSTVVPGGAGAIAFKPVVIMDTGIDSTHPDLNVVLSLGFGQPNGEDQFGHGTHCAGIVGARGVGVVGVVPGVPLWSLRVLDATGAGTSTDIIAALDYLAQNASQVSVCNMSLGGKGVSVAMNNAVTACATAGVVMCVAAGNSSADAGGFSPASAGGAICVAALCDTDGLPGGKGAAGSFTDPDDTFASFSNFGSVVSVIAPGEDIYSTIPVFMGSYGFKSGTSMATPHVAGLSALVLSVPGSLSSGGGGPRNVIGGSGTPLASNPAQVLGFLFQESVEGVAGLAANSDTNRTYPLITGRP